MPDYARIVLCIEILVIIIISRDIGVSTFDRNSSLRDFVRPIHLAYPLQHDVYKQSSRAFELNVIRMLRPDV